MTQPVNTASAEIIDRAAAAFDRGDVAATLAMTLPLLADSPDPRVALLVGEASRKSCHDEHLTRAADRLLALSPEAVRPLIWKGDILRRAGQSSEATQFYTAAVRRTEGAHLPPTLAAEMATVTQHLKALREQLSAFLERFLDDHGLPTEKRSDRVNQSIRLLTGQDQTDLALQRPTLHYLPGLPQQPWYDRADFAWASALEAQMDSIRDELLSVLADDVAFAPYIEGDNHGPARDYQGLLNNPAWGAFYLWRDGEAQADNIARCPKTAAALATVPQPSIANRTPTAMFSLLKPGTHIPPHHGMLNARLICHLPLIVPPDCAMRVGEETRPWAEGKLTVFDDSIEHEAWNKSDETRVVLLFDIARPELAPDEQRAVELCFAAVDAYHARNER